MTVNLNCKCVLCAEEFEDNLGLYNHLIDNHDAKVTRGSWVPT